VLTSKITRVTYQRSTVPIDTASLVSYNEMMRRRSRTATRKKVAATQRQADLVSALRNLHSSMAVGVKKDIVFNRKWRLSVKRIDLPESNLVTLAPLSAR